MSNTLRRMALGAGAVIGAAGTAAALANRAWERSTRQMVDALLTSAAGGVRGEFSEGMVEGMPAPAARYLRSVIALGRRLVSTARVEHRGEFRTSPEARWSPFTSVEHFTVDPPGFVWDARIRMAPLVTVSVRDSYARGEGAMKGAIASVVPVVQQHGSPQLASGALHRYLGEALWLPTALLPGPQVTWDAIDERSVRVNLTDAGTTVSAELHFGADGTVARTSALRYRDVAGRGVLTPWVAYARDYAEVDGLRIPMENEVVWMLPEGPFAYWRGRIEKIEYDPLPSSDLP